MQDKTLHKKAGIYLLCVGDHYYIGQASDLRKRWHQHRRRLQKRQHYNYVLLREASRQPGETLFVVLEYCPESDLTEREEAWLRLYFGEAHCANLMATARTPLGCHHAEETKRKRSEAAKGRRHSDEAKKRIGEASAGRRHTAEAKAKMRAALDNFDRTTISNKIIVTDTSGNVTVYPSQTAAAEALGVSEITISRWACGITPLPGKCPTGYVHPKSRRFVGYDIRLENPERTRWRKNATSEPYKHRSLDGSRRNSKKVVVIAADSTETRFNSLRLAAKALGVSDSRLDSWLTGENHWPGSGTHKPRADVVHLVGWSGRYEE